MNGQNLFYFAYGSNMNPDRIRQRIPFARTIGKAEIRGWKIAERLYADIDREKGGRVEGVLYCLSPGELRQLDAYEGYPSVYDSFMVNAYLDEAHKVRCAAKTTRYSAAFWRGGCAATAKPPARARAVTYAMTPKTKKEREGKAYPEDYRIICAVGARWWGVKNSFGILKPVEAKKEKRHWWFGL